MSEDDLDELLQPTVAAPQQKSGKRPWRVHSQFWIAFFGGILAVTPIAWLNARRLGSSKRTRRLILLTGVVALAAFAACIWKWYPDDRSALRMASRVVAVLEFLVLARIQRDDDNRHQIFGSSEYASLWLPGGLAILAAWGILILVMTADRSGVL